MILFAGVIYLFLNKAAADNLVEQMLHREQVAARSGSIALKVFVSSFGNQVSSFSNRIDILSQIEQKDLEMFVKSWKNTSVSGAVVVDGSGVVKYGFDRQGPTGKGIDLSDRQYFMWAKTAKGGDVLIGSPVQSKIGFASGRYVVPVASPIIRGGKFSGVFVSSFLLDEITSYYLDSLKITNNTRVYLFDQNGVIFSGPAKELVGINYFDYLTKSGIVGSDLLVQKLKNAFLSDDEFKLDIALPDENKNGVLTRFLIAASPIVVGNHHWMLVVTTPAIDALEFLTPFYFTNLGLAGLAFLGFLIIAVRISKIGGYKEGATKEHQIHSGSTPPETLP